MPLEEQARDRAPKIKQAKGKARRKSAREGLKGPPVVLPTYSRKPLPDLGPCPKVSCKDDPCSVHCKDPRTTGGAHAYEHEVDLKWLGWAKGHGDGTFDVSCARCGEVGGCRYVPRAVDVSWG